MRPKPPLPLKIPRLSLRLALSPDQPVRVSSFLRDISPLPRRAEVEEVPGEEVMERALRQAGLGLRGLDLGVTLAAVGVPSPAKRVHRQGVRRHQVKIHKQARAWHLVRRSPLQSG